MPKDKFKPRTFEDYEKKKPYVDSEKRLRQSSQDRDAPEEGEFNRSDKDVREDYFSDEKHREEDRGELPERRKRPLKAPRKVLSHWDTRKAKRRQRRESGR